MAIQFKGFNVPTCKIFRSASFGSRGIKYAGSLSGSVCNFSPWASSATEATETKFGRKAAWGVRMPEIQIHA